MYQFTSANQVRHSSSAVLRNRNLGLIGKGKGLKTVLCLCLPSHDPKKGNIWAYNTPKKNVCYKIEKI